MTGVEPISHGATNQHFTIKLQPLNNKLNAEYYYSYGGGWIRTNDFQVMSLTRLPLLHSAYTPTRT